MTTTPDDQSLSRLEVVVLARLSCAKPPREAKVGEDIANLGEPHEAAARAREVTGTVLPALRQRGLVNERRLTEKGSRALRTELGLDKTPTWAESRGAHLPALRLGLRAGSTDAEMTLKSGKSILLHLVCKEVGVANAPTFDQLCDSLIRQAFAIPAGPLTLRRVRAYALAQKSSAPLAPSAKESVGQIAANIARRALGSELETKTAMVLALTRQWLYDVTSASGSRAVSTSPRAADVQRTLPLQGTIAPSTPAKPVALSADTLLHLVREAIPQIGSDGRFGKEKVFVSAIWQRIERDSRLLDLSLDRFKRWLVTANRDQLLDLARADLVGAMDPRLVRESEIEDLGATFHFVVDRRVNGTGQGPHAR